MTIASIVFVNQQIRINYVTIDRIVFASLIIILSFFKFKSDRFHKRDLAPSCSNILKIMAGTNVILLCTLSYFRSPYRYHLILNTYPY